MAGVVHIPWYANALRADKLAVALSEIAPIALRYGASEYVVYRSDDDRYRFLQSATFDSKTDFERYWYGQEFNDWRADYAGWFQVPLAYVWHSVVAAGSLENRSPVS
jgi:hypothetical protein